jgi:hypothetical protein
METAMFTIGALSMVWAATAALAIYGVVMVLKLKKRIEEVLRYVHDETNNIYRNINENEDKLRGEMRLGEQELNSQINQLNSYVDRRFDKLIDTYLAVKETKKESKQIING